MKTTLRKIAICTLAILALGGAKMSAATETYTFSNIGNNKWTTSGTASVTTGGNTLNLLEIEGNTFGNRFAVSRAGTTNTGGWCLKQYNTQNGLFSQYDARYLSVLNLKDGDQVTVTWFSYNEANGRLNFQTAPSVTESVEKGAEVVSGKTYTISTSEASVNLDFVTAKDSSDPNIVISQIVIVTSVATEAITIGMTTETYNLETITGTWTNESTVDPITIGETAYSRFSTQQANCFQVSGSGWGWQVNWNKWFSINNLKKGDKVWVKYDTSNSQVVNFDDASQIGETGTVQLESEKWYTLAKDAEKLKLVNQNNTNGAKANYKEVRIQAANSAITAGTLVSNTALDFTDSEVSAYYASSANAGTVTFKQIYKVAAGTPIYIKAVAGYYEIPVLDGESETITTNLLKGSATSTTELTSTDATKYYVYGILNSQAGFYPVSTSGKMTSAAGKAYLELTKEQAAAAARITISFEDNETTGIGDAVRGEMMNDAWYTLQGVRVAQPTRGIYVRNGKKVYVK